jgi:HEPN domain-containing protein
MKRKANDTNPKALLNYARQYFKAAEVVFEKEPKLTRPLNFLYFHALELLLKSFLRANGRKPGRNHEIENLYKEATGLGLKIAGDRYSIVSLLRGANTDQAFRYGTSKSITLEPSLDWTREVIGKLMEAVSQFVDPNNELKTPGPVAALRIVLRKPVSKAKSRPE